jgi:hypothetical protein
VIRSGLSPSVPTGSLHPTDLNTGEVPHRQLEVSMTNRRREGHLDGLTMTESQLSELQNMRVLLEEARVLSRNLAHHRRARLEGRIGEALEEVDQHISELRTTRR